MSVGPVILPRDAQDSRRRRGNGIAAEYVDYQYGQLQLAIDTNRSALCYDEIDALTDQLRSEPHKLTLLDGSRFPLWG